ncbi:tyrosine-type recombinase/integrase [Brevibacterium samyangense]
MTPDGRRAQKKFQKKSDAQAFWDQYREQKRAGVTYDAKAAKAKNVDELFADWVEYLETAGGTNRTGVAYTTLRDYKSIHKNGVSPYIGLHLLERVNARTIEQWQSKMTADTNQRGGRVQPRARAKALRQASRMLRWAVKRGWMPRNPIDDYDGIPTGTDGKRQIPITARQLGRLAQCADPNVSDVFLFAGMTGLRIGELAELKVKDISLHRKRATVARSRVAGRVKAPKNGKGRVIALTQQAVDIATARTVGKEPEDHLFTTKPEKSRRPNWKRDGDPGLYWFPLDHSNFTKRHTIPAVMLASSAVARLQSALGIMEHDEGLAWFGPETEKALAAWQRDHDIEPTGVADPDTRAALALEDADRPYTLRRDDRDFSDAFRNHDLRHTYASIAAAQGATPHVIQRQLGHSDPGFTMRVYAHLFEDDLDSFTDGMTEAFGGSV